MKILHVIASLSPFSGGPTVLLKALAREQAKQGHEVNICTTISDTPRGEVIVPTDLPIIIDQVAVLYFNNRCFRPLCVSGTIVQWINKTISDYDIVHIHGLYRFPTTYAAWRAKRKGVPYIIMPHGCLDPFLYKQSRYNLLLKRIYERLLEIPNLNNASAVHYTVEEEAKRADFLKISAKKIILPYGIEWESYRRLPSRGRFRRKIKIHKQTPLTLYLGRINFKKGLDLLVPAFVRVLKKIPEARLAIVGPDNEGYGLKVRQWCVEQGIQKNVFFLDYLQPEKVKEAYMDANVFVLPSYTENFGLTVVEAMACGCPVVISDQVNIWQEIKAAGAGIVVKLNSSELADAICRVLLDKDLARDMGEKGRHAAESYAWPPIVQKLTGIYEELIEENRSSIRFQRLQS